jgi:aminomethyltransferase
VTQPDPLKKTPLHDCHLALGARLVPFVGWQMPVQYAGTVAEHMAVRTAVGLFDVSHMGEIEIRGPQALDLVQRLTPNDAASLSPGRIQYSALTTERGTFVDDVLVYRLGEERFLLVVNAANAAKDLAWLLRHGEGFEAEVLDRNDEYAQIAIQGPRAQEVLGRVTSLDLAAIRYYRFARGEVLGREALVSRTGYTGEDGFEIYLPPAEAPALWTALLEAGEAEGIQAAGLGARDTLRLEACMALYGNDIDETTTVLEAGLDWIVKWEAGDFLGRAALAEQRERGLTRKLCGFRMTGRGIPRPGYAVRVNGDETGPVTSGSHAPFLKENVGLTYLPVESSEAGTALAVVVRDREVEAEVVATPFYRRKKKKRKKSP